jgi:hypothetical protein
MKEETLSTRTVSRCYEQDKLGGVSQGTAAVWKLIAQTRDIPGTQRERNVHSWKPLPSNGSEDVTVDNVCV